MNTKRVLLFLCFCIVILSIQSFAQYLYLDSSLTITTPSTFDSVRITSTGRLTADDSIAVIGNMIIDNGGVVTHSQRLLSGLRLNVIGTLEVKSGGSIDVSGKGLLGGHPIGVIGGPGETFNENDSIVAGAGGAEPSSAGASYGGWGAGGNSSASSPPYGLIEDPRHLGSGAGGNRYSWGGNGGGRVTITAAACIIDGAVRANGAHGVGGFTNTGGGSGGAIKILAGNLSGAGAMEAIGGNGQQYTSYSGSGGGGRIAIFYNSMTLPSSNISARGGTSQANAPAGTIYLKNNAQPSGVIIVNNSNIICPLFTPWKTMLPTIESLALQQRAQLRVSSSDGSASIGDVLIESNSILLLDTNSTVSTLVVQIDAAILTTNVDRSFPTGTDLQLRGGGTINLQNNRTLTVGIFDTTNIKSGTINLTDGCRLSITSNTAMIGGGVTLVKDGSFGENDSLSSLTILNGGIITHSLRLLKGLRLNIIGALEVKSGGSIDVSGKGLLGGSPGIGGGRGETYNENDSIVAGSTGSENTGGGGSYGGRGGSGAQGGVSSEPYGLLEDVRHLGSGGGGNRYFWGGHGGGLSAINATTCIVDGVVRANGGEGSGGFDNSGGGSGGGIRIHVGSLSGSGRIEAIGGAAYSWDIGGCGGGGRIAIFYDSMSLPDANLYVRSGTGGVTASAGTIYLKKNAQSLGSVVLSNNGIDCPLYTPWKSALPSFQTLTVRNRARLQTIASNNVTFNEVHIESISTLLLDTNTAAQTPVVNIDGATLTANVDRSFPVGTDLQMINGGTINMQNNRTLVVGVFDTTNIKSGTINLTDGCRLSITSNTAMIGGGVTLVKDGSFGENDSLSSLTILNGGIITHSLRLLKGLRLNIIGALEVKSGGSIDVSGKGLLGGQPRYPVGGRGETYNANDSIVAGASGSGSRCAGGSYGGRGADASAEIVSNTPYGFLEEPRHLGSGGGGNSYFWGGHGGGRVTINANVCIVNGSMKANGGSGSGGFDPSGGGSGGAILLTVGSLSGTGVIEAIGGAGNAWTYYSGSGGGGRIAIFYDANTFPSENIKIRGGSGTGATASAGTIYLKDATQSMGSVVVDNGGVNSTFYTSWRSAQPTFQQLTLRNRAQLRSVVGDNASFDEVGIESNSTLLLDTNSSFATPVLQINSATLTMNIDRSFPIGTNLQLTGGGTINVQNNRTLSVGVFDTTNIHSGTINITKGSQLEITSNTATIGAGVTLVKDGTFGETDSIQTLTINNGGMLTHSTRLLAGIRLNVLDTLDIKTGGAIDVSSKGLLGGHNTTYLGGPGETYNASDSIVAGASGSQTRCAGASYGGRGADASAEVVSNTPYGFLEQPRHLGSGGGGNRYFLGGNGGGRITINANACIVNGALRANGGSGSGGFDPSGGGSGGAILLTVGSLSGTGVVEAIGGAGNAYTYYSGSGGGGRVAIFYDSLNLPTQNISVRGGSGTGATASAGTIYLKYNTQSLGSVIVDNANISCQLYTPWRSNLSTLQNLTVIRAGKLQVSNEVDVVGKLLLVGGKIGRP